MDRWELCRMEQVLMGESDSLVNVSYYSPSKLATISLTDPTRPLAYDVFEYLLMVLGTDGWELVSFQVGLSSRLKPTGNMTPTHYIGEMTLSGASKIAFFKRKIADGRPADNLDLKEVIRAAQEKVQPS